MTKKKAYKNPKYHVDFADLEIELRKSIKKDQISERLGVYIIKIVQSILASTHHVRTYNKTVLATIEFEAYEYILTRLLKNYNTDKKAGFAFIKAMALNRIKTTKRSIHTKGLNQEVAITHYNRKKRTYETVTFLTIQDIW